MNKTTDREQNVVTGSMDCLECIATVEKVVAESKAGILIRQGFNQDTDRCSTVTKKKV